MSVQDMQIFNAFLYIILIVKILFLISMILSVYFSYKGLYGQSEKYEEYQDKMEHLFILLMGVLMLILFYPRNKGVICVSGHTKLFLFIFGILSILDILKNFKKSRESHHKKK
jgi:hypothetical protein